MQNPIYIVLIAIVIILTGMFVFWKLVLQDPQVSTTDYGSDRNSWFKFTK